MSHSVVLEIGLFCAMQVVAQLFFKWGSTSDARWLWGFLVGNLFGFSSIWLLMLVYRNMNPNIALGICGGGAFLLSQLALTWAFKSEVSLLQWTGVVAIVAGMILLAAGKSGTL
jgi:multidrug transporter EmrE-like cation transporter